MKSNLSKSVFNIRDISGVEHNQSNHDLLKTPLNGFTPKRKNSINLKQIFKFSGQTRATDENQLQNQNEQRALNSSITNLNLVTPKKAPAPQPPGEQTRFKSQSAVKSVYARKRQAAKSGLMKSKNMSFSATDLRQLKHIPQTEFCEQFKDDIQDRRHDMYIADIEMNSLLQIGPIIRNEKSTAKVPFNRSDSTTDSDRLLIELESNDCTSFSLVFRAIYDGNEYEKFMSRLQARIRSHDKDIERMCNANYQGFVDCIHDLLQVRPKAEILKKEIIEINQDVQKSSETVQRKAEELIRYRKIVCNIGAAIEHLSTCLPVLKMYSKLIQQMECKRYYPALKTLEQLESNYLPRVSHYRFAQVMRDKIPQIRDEIKNASMSDLKDFLENVRKLSSRVGELAMKHAAHQQNIEDSLLYSSGSVESSTNNSPIHVKKASNGAGQRSSKKRHAPPPPVATSAAASTNSSTLTLNATGGDVDGETESDVEVNGCEEELSATDVVDFSPVYRCLHIFGCLGARDSFERYYQQQRLQQSKLVLQSPTNMHENIDGYKSFFCSVVGFFVIENHILNTAHGLITKNFLNELWEQALTSVTGSIRTFSSFCVDDGLMLKIKRIIILFSHTLQSYGYNVNPFFNLLLEIREQYNELLMKKWLDVFKRIFDADNYHPIQVKNQAEYQEIIRDFPFYEREVVATSNADFPKKFPFSLFVPKVFAEVKRFIAACFEFSENLNLSQTEVQDMVRKSTNLLLTSTLSGSLSVLIQKPNLGLLQLIQITINTNYLEDSMQHLEKFIFKPQVSVAPVSSSSAEQEVTPSPIGGVGDRGDITHLASLRGISMFKDARNDAETQIYILLNQKIDEFFDIANYDWMLGEPSGVASSHISDLLKFLRSTFEAFTNLPLKVAQTACLSACKHMASSLLSILLDENVKAISSGALDQFNLDLLQCEVFGAEFSETRVNRNSSEQVKGAEVNAFEMCFAELRQMMNLFSSCDWSTYFADFGKQDSKYLRVNPQNALILIEKIREADKNKNLFANLKKTEREKRKLMETIHKQLKSYVVNNGV